MGIHLMTEKLHTYPMTPPPSTRPPSLPLSTFMKQSLVRVAHFHYTDDDQTLLPKRDL